MSQSASVQLNHNGFPSQGHSWAPGFQKWADTIAIVHMCVFNIQNFAMVLNHRKHSRKQISFHDMLIGSTLHLFYFSKLEMLPSSTMNNQCLYILMSKGSYGNDQPHRPPPDLNTLAFTLSFVLLYFFLIKQSAKTTNITD